MFDVQLGCLRRVVRRVVMMAVGRVRVMCGEMMIPRFVMPRGFTVMMRGAFVMFCRTIVMLCCFSGHGCLLRRMEFKLGGRCVG
jgi:hypothetical protein